MILTAGALLAVFFLTFYMHQTNKGKVLSQFNENQLRYKKETEEYHAKKAQKQAQKPDEPFIIFLLDL